MTLPTKDELLAAARELRVWDQPFRRPEDEARARIAASKAASLLERCAEAEPDDLSALRKENEALGNIITEMRRCVQGAVTARALLAKEEKT